MDKGFKCGIKEKRIAKPNEPYWQKKKRHIQLDEVNKLDKNI